MTDPTVNPEELPKQIADEAGADAGPAGEKPDAETRQALDELKTALGQALAAATRLGHVAQAKAREEWKTTRPELEKVAEEVKRGIEVAANKATTALDSVGKRIDKSGGEGASPDASSTGAATTTEQPTEPVDRPPAEQPPL
jgi:hypothetical protein